MHQGIRPRTTCLGFALVALAVLAIVPDCHDVTSFSISLNLQSLLTDELPPTDAAAPLGEHSQDEMADEVCAPLAACAHNTVRRSIKGSPGLISNTARRRALSQVGGGLHRSQPGERIARTGDLISILCRFTC